MELYEAGTVMLFYDKFKKKVVHRVPLSFESESYMEMMKDKWTNIILASGVSEFRLEIKIIKKCTTT